MLTILNLDAIIDMVKETKQNAADFNIRPTNDNLQKVVLGFSCFENLEAKIE